MNPRLPDASLCTVCAVTLWSEAESRFAADSYAGTGAPGSQRISPGDRRVLFSAPNSVNYWRGEYQQRAARWTGAGVEAMAAVTGLSSIAMTGPPRQVPFRDSPEYAYADRLRELVDQESFVLDVLGMRDRQVDVCIGLGPLPDARSEQLADRLRRGLTNRGVRVGINTPFPALTAVSVTSFCQTELGVSALQLAVAAWLRDPEGSPTMAKLALDVVRDSVTELL